MGLGYHSLTLKPVRERAQGNPVAALGRYRSHIQHLLPGLLTLDDSDTSTHAVRKRATATSAARSATILPPDAVAPSVNTMSRFSSFGANVSGARKGSPRRLSPKKYRNIQSSG